MNDLDFFEKLDKMLNEAKGDLTGDDAYDAEMALIDDIDKELNDFLNNPVPENNKGKRIEDILLKNLFTT